MTTEDLNERIDALEHSNPSLYNAFYRKPLIADSIRDIPIHITVATTVVNVKVKYLRPQYENLQDWLDKGEGRHVYVGRNMEFYVPGAKASKWKNPFSVKKYGREGCLEKYRDYIENHPTLMDELHELKGKVLGCWCYPEGCHASILAEMCDELNKMYLHAWIYAPPGGGPHGIHIADTDLERFLETTKDWIYEDSWVYIQVLTQDGKEVALYKDIYRELTPKDARNIRKMVRDCGYVPTNSKRVVLSEPDYPDFREIVEIPFCESGYN